MSGKNKKQFGIWMDSHQATIVGREQPETGNFIILAHEKNPSQGSNSNENASNNAERTLQSKFFKGITSHIQNAEELHVTGTGQVQEQFINYLAETPQFKNTVAKQSTSNKMAEEKLVEYITEKLN
ncbi:MAG: hypothetical protein ABR502_07780 [Chitinophagaceae bacterium]